MSHPQLLSLYSYTLTINTCHLSHILKAIQNGYFCFLSVTTHFTALVSLSSERALFSVYHHFRVNPLDWTEDFPEGCGKTNSIIGWWSQSRALAPKSLAPDTDPSVSQPNDFGKKAVSNSLSLPHLWNGHSIYCTWHYMRDMYLKHTASQFIKT